MSLPKIFTPEEARAKLGIGRTRFYEMLRDGRIKSIRNGRIYLVPESSLAEYIEQQIHHAEGEGRSNVQARKL